MILDEATSALDRQNQTMCSPLLRERAKRGVTVLLITHDTEVAEQCDTCLNLTELNREERKIILGLNAYHADSSAAIFLNGELIAATEEERFRRIKHWAGFPSRAIKFCLNEVGCTLADVEAITIGRDPSAKKTNKATFVFKHPLVAKTL